jgi:hypothetical protein
MLPAYLKSFAEEPTSEADLPIPDSTSSPVKCPASPQTCPSPPPSLSQRLTPQASPEPDLHCSEDLSHDSALSEEFENDECCLSPPASKASPASRSSSPLSAVDIFSEFDANILQVIFDPSDYTILVS